MTSAHFTRIADYRDIKTVGRYREIAAAGGDTLAFLADQKIISRDNARTPFQWDATAHAGFTTGQPWLRANPNYPGLNEAAEAKDPGSVLAYFRRAVAVRRQHKVLIYGQYRLLDADNPHVYAYTRTLGPARVLVVLNFSADARAWPLPAGLKLAGAPWLNNYPGFAPAARLALQPWQALVLPLR
ncbi:MAG: alpha-glucosidase C-terminal domain-containing protein [Janthinobacterium lividum]